MRPTVFLFALAVLAACAPTTPDDRVIETVTEDTPPNVGIEESEPKLADIELCDARDYRALIGSNVASTSFLLGERLRVYSVNDIITQDYIPQRTNVVHEENGTITRVYCG